MERIQRSVNCVPTTRPLRRPKKILEEGTVRRLIVLSPMPDSNAYLQKRSKIHLNIGSSYTKTGSETMAELLKVYFLKLWSVRTQIKLE